MKDHHEVACHLFDIGRFDLAERELCSELKENPQRHSSMAMLAVARSNLDRTDEALESATAALAGDPQNPYCHYAHAIVMWKADRWRPAMAAMAEARRLAPDDPDYPATLADYHAGFDEYGEAIRLCEDALRLDPNHLSALCTMAYSFVEMNRWSQARDTALQALEINADDAYAHAISGWANLGLKNHTQALDHFLQALRKIPSYQWAQEGLIEALQCHNWLYRFLVVTCLGKFRSRKAGAEPRTRSGQQSKEGHLPIWAVILIIVWSVWAMTRLEEAGRDSKGMTSLDVGLFF